MKNFISMCKINESKKVGLVKGKVIIRNRIGAKMKLRNGKDYVGKTKMCENCGVEFTMCHQAQKFCSKDCQAKKWRKIHGKLPKPPPRPKEITQYERYLRLVKKELGGQIPSDRYKYVDRCLMCAPSMTKTLYEARFSVLQCVKLLKYLHEKTKNDAIV